MVFVIVLEVSLFSMKISLSLLKIDLMIILDHIYLETNKSNEPYSIACILDFRLVS